MTDLIKRDPFRNLFGFPRWDDWGDLPHQKGLRLRETDKDIVIEAVVAGVPSENVDVDIEDGVLTIRAEKKEVEEGKDEYKSSSYQYYYTCALSGGAWDKAEAEVENGVVIVNIPKAESARPRKISIKTKNK